MRHWQRHALEILTALLITSAAWAQTPTAMTPSQRTPRNSAPLVSVANTAVAHTITGRANERARIISFKASCSAGTSTVTITDGGATVWSTTTGAILTVDGGAIWLLPLTLTSGNTVVVTLGACGGGNVGTLTVQADQW